MDKQAIRVATAGDAAAIAAIYAHYVEQTAISFEIEPPGVAEIAKRMARITATFPWLVYEEDGEVLGYSYASPHHERAAYCWSADGAVYVKHGSIRRGVGRSLYQTLIAILRLQGFHSLFGGITLPNAASVGLHESCGFLPVGVYKEAGFKLGAWYDVGWWGLRLGDASLHPVRPRIFAPEMLGATLQVLHETLTVK